MAFNHSALLAEYKALGEKLRDIAFSHYLEGFDVMVVGNPLFLKKRKHPSSVKGLVHFVPTGLTRKAKKLFLALLEVVHTWACRSLVVGTLDENHDEWYIPEKRERKPSQEFVHGLTKEDREVLEKVTTYKVRREVKDQELDKIYDLLFVTLFYSAPQSIETWAEDRDVTESGYVLFLSRKTGGPYRAIRRFLLKETLEPCREALPLVNDLKDLVMRYWV